MSDNTFTLLSADEQLAIIDEKLKTLEAHFFNTSIDVEMATVMHDEKTRGVLVAQQTGLAKQMNRMTEIRAELLGDEEGLDEVSSTS